MKKTSWGFDTKNVNTNIRPQDNFYEYANGGWLKRTKIPSSESRWGTFMILRYETEQQVHTIVQELLNTKKSVAGSPEQLVGDFFTSGMDAARRKAVGITPLTPWLKRIDAITSTQDLLDVVAELHRIGVGALWGQGVAQDAKNSERYALHFFQAGLGLPDKDYYLKKDAESTRVREAYVKHIPSLLRTMGYSAVDAARAGEVIMSIETRLAKHSMDKVERRDVHKTYTSLSVAGLSKRIPEVDWERYLKKLGAKNPGNLILMQPDFLKAASKLAFTLPLEEWKVYLRWQLLNGFASLLSPEIEKKNFAFYGKILSGAQHMKPEWRRSLAVVNGLLGELLGKLYVDRHFPPASKVKMKELVDDLFDAYEARITDLDWMTPATKKKALKKLRSLNPKIGYPDRWKRYTGLVIHPDDFVGNYIRIALYEHAREMKKLTRPIDRKEWHMYPQTVNAYFSPRLNDIVFPAAILQPPFFGVTADAALNYGCIGSVIGHEMTHGFDDQGSNYDEHGNIRPWWSKEDRKRFEEKTKMLVRQFDAYTVADGVKVNGGLTLGENVADLGGVAIALDAYRAHLARHPEEDCVVGGYTPTQRFFLGFAVFERERSRPEGEKMRVLTDPHSPGKFRINGPVSNMIQFYEAFGVNKGDKLYRDAKNRVQIW